MKQTNFLTEWLKGCRNAFADVYNRRFVNDHMVGSVAELITAASILALSLTIFLAGPVLIPLVGLCVLTSERFTAWRFKRRNLKAKAAEQPTVYP